MTNGDLAGGSDNQISGNKFDIFQCFRLTVPILDLFKDYNRNVNGKCKLVIVPEELLCFLTPAHIHVFSLRFICQSSYEVA